MTRICTALGAAIVFTAAGALPASAQGWEKLGERTVNFAPEGDVVQVSAEHVYKKIYIKVEGGKRGVHFRDVKVHFRNGKKQDIKIRKLIPAGDSTRKIDLLGGGRSIKKVVFFYDSVGPRPKRRGKRMMKKARVQLWAQRGGKVVAKKPVKKVALSWENLGQRKVKVKLKGGEWDVIPVRAHEGIFRAIRLKVKDAPVHFQQLKVVFGNGEKVDVPLKKLFKAGQETRVIDLPGKNRIIKKVQMKYKTLAVGKGRATVVLWGGHPAKAAAKKVVKKAPVAKGGATFLGERTVKHRAEKDTIMVTATEGRFKKLQLRVRGAGIKIHRINIVFGNGENLDKNFAGGKLVPAGTESPWIDLPGKKRVVKKVVLFYKTKRKRGPKAHVRLFGK